MSIEENPKRKTHTSAAAVKKYKAKNYTQFKIELNLQKDADILEYLSMQENKTLYIKELIRADIRTNNK